MTAHNTPLAGGTAYDHLQRAGDIADKALRGFHRQSYADRINSLWEALLQVSNERIEYNNIIGKEPEDADHRAEQAAA